MLIKKGISVSPGVAITKAVVLEVEDQPIPRRAVPPALIQQELMRLDQALAGAAEDIQRQGVQAESQVGSELAKIFGAHLGMLQDPHLTDQFKHMIQEERVTAEYAVYSVMRDWVQKFRRIEDRRFRDRAADIWDLERQILRHLIQDRRSDLDHLPHEAGLVARDLTPSQTASLDKERIKAIATDAGGRTSHTAILAHALGIPAIVGLESLTGEVNNGDVLIVDANNGLVIVNPDAAQLMEYREHLRRIAARGASLDELARLPAITHDQVPVAIEANIEFPSEIAAALDKGAAGIGLYRTEFLFLASDTEPTEENQYEAYCEAVRALQGRPLTIRTLDLGADKVKDDRPDNEPAERNPFLGCRSIRLCLQNLPLFKTQLRAILRCSTEGPVRVMFPMISNITELRLAKMVLNDVMEDLEEQGIPFNRGVPVGIMIEVPSAALQAKTLAREVAFFSIGTNDLIQYTVAVDRGNERIANLYSPAHPAVLMLIKETIRAAHRAKIDVSLCGEMAGEPVYTMLLLGLGLRHFSIAPPAIPEVKRVLRAVSIHQCQRVARKASSFDADREVLHYLHDEMRRILPDALDGRSFES
jgi:phosphoenolpyruvate-protein phosphotransferase (PTS system enzyme I)